MKEHGYDWLTTQQEIAHTDDPIRDELVVYGALARATYEAKDSNPTWRRDYAKAQWERVHDVLLGLAMMRATTDPLAVLDSELTTNTKRVVVDLIDGINTELPIDEVNMAWVARLVPEHREVPHRRGDKLLQLNELLVDPVAWPARLATAETCAPEDESPLRYAGPLEFLPVNPHVTGLDSSTYSGEEALYDIARLLEHPINPAAADAVWRDIRIAAHVLAPELTDRGISAVKTIP